MYTITNIVTGVIASLVAWVITLVVDRYVNRKGTRISRPWWASPLRLLILIVVLIPSSMWLSREQPQLSMLPTPIVASYSQNGGLRVIGDFAGRDGASIYLLAHPSGGSNQVEVWTVVTEVIEINKDRWRARINFSPLGGKVNPGDTYAVVGMMTRMPVKVGFQFSSAELSASKATLTEVLDVTIKEVTDE